MTEPVVECDLCRGLTPPPGAKCKSCGRMSDAPRPHTCHARDCTRPVPPEMLMCFAHWRRVPRAIQQAVWRSYRRGQCDDMNPSRAWLKAADAAIGAVAKKEGLGLTPNETAALAEFENKGGADGAGSR